MSKNVLILCTGNSCRSQMAQVIWQKLGGEQWTAHSAGSNPSGYVHPLALVALNEIGLPNEGLTSKHMEQFYEQKMDQVVTVCDNAKGSCPALPGFADPLHWPFDDPADATGSDEEKLKVFRRVRDEIYQRIESHLKNEND